MKRFAQDDGFAGVLTKNIPIRLTLMGLASWAKFSRPRSTSSGQALRDSKAVPFVQTLAAACRRSLGCGRGCGCRFLFPEVLDLLIERLAYSRIDFVGSVNGA